MPLARVVTFDGVNSDRMNEMQREMEGNERPDDVPAKEIVVLHDPDAQKSLVILFFDILFFSLLLLLSSAKR